VSAEFFRGCEQLVGGRGAALTSRFWDRGQLDGGGHKTFHVRLLYFVLRLVILNSLSLRAATAKTRVA